MKDMCKFIIAEYFLIFNDNVSFSFKTRRTAGLNKKVFMMSGNASYSRRI